MNTIYENQYCPSQSNSKKNQQRVSFGALHLKNFEKGFMGLKLSCQMGFKEDLRLKALLYTIKNSSMIQPVVSVKTFLLELLVIFSYTGN